MSEQSLYDNPLVSRYAGLEMAELWGQERKFSTWRKLWVALAEAESELGLTQADGKAPRIRPEQLEQLRAHVNDINFDVAAQYETRFRHDVMAHIHAYGDQCPLARDIIHLGATSCYVTDNTDLILMRDGLKDIARRLAAVIVALGALASRERDTATVGYTHFQPAQLTTVGKRACLWGYDFYLDLLEVEHRVATLKFRGVKGATGTQASFLALFHGDHEKVKGLDALVASKMGFDSVYPFTGQTYSRKVDSQIIAALGGIGQTAHKFGSDLRLLANRQEILEPAEQEQIGSSAMPYKRNPMRAERMCGLARFLSSLVTSVDQTTSSQWLERTLDDSVNRRLTLPQAFLAADGVLGLALNIARGAEVCHEIIAAHAADVLPYMATENILMAAVEQGADRQEIHERIRVHSRAAAEKQRSGSTVNDLMDRLAADPAFRSVDFKQVSDIRKYVGRAPQQVDEFLDEVANPVGKRYPRAAQDTANVNV
jgi:adenylosuccinate lyase